nr:reverse transcriptase domain-containing protein [Tanacetum cinerariifolium]
MRTLLLKPKKLGRIARWAIELGEHEIEFKPKNAIKAQILIDFLAETQEDDDELIDEEEHVHPKPEPQVEDGEYDLQQGKGKGSATYEQAALSLLDLYKPKKKSADTDKMNREGDTEIQNSGEQQGEDVFKKVDLEEKTAKLDEGQARTDPVYSNVYESLKHTTEEYVHLKNPLCSSGALSSMKNLKDNFTFGDQFINDNLTEEDPGKINVETKVESMVTVPIHQASSLVSPLSTPVIDLTPLKPVPPPIGIGPQSALLRVIPNSAIAHELCAGSPEVIPSSKNKVKVFIVIGKQDRRKERTKAEKDL